MIEQQLKDALFNAPADRRPVVVGKTDERGQQLLKSDGELTPLRDRRGHRRALRPRRFRRPHQAALRSPEAPRRPPGAQRVRHGARALFLLRLPAQHLDQGARRLDGDGRHRLPYLAIGMERNTKTFTHMGAEGATWVGASHFTDMPHVFQNLGDGTYFHSGLLAIRHAVATNTTITYKILYNDAVAMTGGQPHDGNVHPWTISQQVHAEGVRRIALVSDEPDKYPVGTEWAPGVTFHHRDAARRGAARAARVQGRVGADLRPDLRRREAPPPQARHLPRSRPSACSSTRRSAKAAATARSQSNCLSVDAGRDRVRHASAPSTSRPATRTFPASTASARASSPSKAAGCARARPTATPATRRPSRRCRRARPAVGRRQPYGVLITGIGGTGVVTIGAIMGMAAHIEGKGATVLDQLGMAQKGGAVISHVRIGADARGAARRAAGRRRRQPAAGLRPGRQRQRRCAGQARAGHRRTPSSTPTRPSPANSPAIPTSPSPAHTLRLSIEAAAGAEACDFLDATRLATALMGDSIATNLFMLGYAYQKGLVPLGHEALERAIELNGAAVPMNLAAFRWGRRAAHDRAGGRRSSWRRQRDKVVPFAHLSQTLDEIVAVAGEASHRLPERRAGRALPGAGRARSRTPSSENAGPDRPRRGGGAQLRQAAGLQGRVRGGAALSPTTAFQAQLSSQFEGDYKLKFHLAPPLFASRDPRDRPSA